MLRIGSALVTLTLALFQFGCEPPNVTEEDTSDVMSWMEVTNETNAPPKRRNSGIYGTWINERIGVGHFDKLVLMTDSRYHSSRQVVCVRAPCPPIEANGTFELYNREGVQYLALVEKGAQEAQRYEFAYKTDLLQLRHILPGSAWYSMEHAAVAWCAETRDCSVQPLPPGPCAGGYTCSENQCAWQCGAECKAETN